MNKVNKVELLAPAKNLKAIKAGLSYADAFYFGAQKFNMRKLADNFSFEQLKTAVELCHSAGKKAYFVSNILVYENELDDLKEHLEYAKSINFDACIVNDLAAIQICKDIGMDFHISTQQNISNSSAALFFERYGAKRIILARECSLQQIKEIAHKLESAEIEAFVHGAMCTMISGRCYFSMTCGNSDEFSANRGRCTQPCRREWILTDKEHKNEFIYDGTRFLNSRDLCMIGYIPEMIDAGIKSFKIEGRMRDPIYVEIVTKTYREAINSYYEGTFSKKKVGKWIYELKKAYNRGFTQGFYFKRATEEDQQHNSPSNLSHWRMIRLGTLTAVSALQTGKSVMAKLKLVNGRVWEGLDVIVQGDKNSDTYFNQKIKYIEREGPNPNPNTNSNLKSNSNTKSNPDANPNLKSNSNVKSNNERKGIRIKKSPRGKDDKPVFLWLKLKERIIPESDSVYIFTDQTYINRQKKKKPHKKSGYYKL